MQEKSGKTIKPPSLKRAVAKLAAATSTASHSERRREWLAKNAKHAAAYLDAALATGEPGDLMQALRDIADARGGIVQLAQDTGLNRETLYRTLSQRGNPQLSSLMTILRASGLRLTVMPA
ncbi:MAG: addiction module antidote protein [Burkholderiales bacterium]